MKYFHSIKLTVFCKPEDDEEKIKQALVSLVPFDFEKEKIELKSQKADIILDRKITILEVTLQKQRYTQAFFEYLMSKLDDRQRKILVEQKESRLDDTADFFIRLDKEYLLENKFVLTDDGNCFHIRISIAAYPAKKEVAMKILDKILA